MPRAILGNERAIVTRAERDALRIAKSVGVDAWIKTGRRLVARSGLAVTVDTQHFSTNQCGALRTNAQVVVTRRHIDEAIKRAESHATAVVRAGSAKGMLGCGWFVVDVRNDVNAI